MEDLNRFIEAQEDYFDIAYDEIKSGKKKTHWMWYIFPQIHGLGFSETSVFYSIKSINEAISYLNNEFLYNNMIKICNLLLNTKVKNPATIFGGVDSLKLRNPASQIQCRKHSLLRKQITLLACFQIR